MNDELGEFPEQWTEQTREALNAAVEELVAALRAHAEHVAHLHGRTSEMQSVFEVNQQVERAIAAWNERAFDHTGTLPVSLAGLDALPAARRTSATARRSRTRTQLLL